jgi:ATP-binding cassette subfamily C protein CydCD
VGQNRSSELVTTAMRGLDSLDVYFSRYLPQLVLAAIIPLAVGITIFTNDILSAVIIAFTVPLIPFFMALVGWFTQAQVDKQWQSLQRLSGHFLDLITGLPTLKAFNRSKGQSKGLLKVGEDYRVTTMSVLRISFLSSFVLELISTISVALVAVSIGLRLVNGTMHLLGTQFHAMTEGLEAADRVFTILDKEVTKQIGTTINGSITSIEFKSVSVTYPGATSPALAQFSGTFPAGCISIITGVSGSGKTTALATLLKFVTSYQGSITVNGLELRELDTHTWRKSIAYLPQTPWLPHGTLRDAMVMAAPVGDQELLDICASVGLNINDVEQFPYGLDTIVSSKAGLSSGQRRRVALARALLQQKPVLILDEPTAAVDSDTEELIARVMSDLARQGTLVIAVAHRPSLIATADHVVSVRDQVNV